MWNERTLLNRRLGGTDIHVTVYLPAVGVDDFAFEFPGYANAETTFTNTGRPDDSDYTAHEFGLLKMLRNITRLHGTRAYTLLYWLLLITW